MGRKMKKYILFLMVIALLATSCAFGKYKGARPVCRHYAVLQALTFHDFERYKVRICIGVTPKGRYHAQAQAFIGIEWKWLVYEKGRVRVGKQENFKPTECMDVKTFIKRFLPTDYED